MLTIHLFTTSGRGEKRELPFASQVLNATRRNIHPFSPRMGSLGRDEEALAFSNILVSRKVISSQRSRAFSLIELLCVMTIIAILASLMFPALSKALRKARGLSDHLGSSSGIEMRIDEVIASYSRYRAAHPNHGKLNRKQFIHELQLSPAAETWLNLASVEYRPFAASDPPEQPVIIVYPSPGSGAGEIQYLFTVGNLISH